MTYNNNNLEDGDFMTEMIMNIAYCLLFSNINF